MKETKLNTIKQQEGDLTNMLSVTEVSEILQVSTSKVRRWSDKGILKTSRYRNERRFKIRDIAEFLVNAYKNNYFD